MKNTTKNKIFAYIRVSTNKQDLENQKLQIKSYCYDNNIAKVDEYIAIEVSSRKTNKERRIDELLTRLNSGDTLIVSELSRLGRSIGQVILLIDELIKNKINVICIKENIKVNGKMDVTTKTMITMFSLFAEIERDMISTRIKDALRVKKQQGVTLGRKKGSYSSKLDIHKVEIKGLLAIGVTKTKIAEKFGVTRAHMSNYISKRLSI